MLAFMLYIAYICLMWKWGHQGDMMIWMEWSKYMYHHGFTSIYNTECNYLPAYLYFVYLHVKIQGNLTDIGDNLYTLKYYTLVFDLLGAIAAVWFVRDESRKIFYFLLLMFNVAFIYNTAMWGQLDAIYTFWGFAALIAALERRPVLSVLFLLIAFNFKIQALVFVPAIGLLLLPQYFTKGGLKKALTAIALAVPIQLMILLPFIIEGKMERAIRVLTSYVGYYPYPSVAAFNLWFWLIPKDIEGMFNLKDTDTFFLISYKQAGSLMFCLAVFIAAFPLMKHLYRKYVRNEQLNFPLEKVFLISALSSLSFFYFNTEMHDRYSHSALISLAAYAFCTRRYLPLILGSVAYLLNMEKILNYFALRNYHTLLFEPRFVSALYFVLIVYLYYRLYTKPTDGASYRTIEL